MTDQRLIELEERLAYQEDMIESLNHQVAQHSLELMNLTKELIKMREWVKNNQPLNTHKGEDEAPPPHY